MQMRRSYTKGLGDVMFDLTNARRRGHVIKNNEHTVIVEFIVGNNKRVRIKRHKRKNNVVPIPIYRDYRDTIAQVLGDYDVMWETCNPKKSIRLMEVLYG